MRRRRNRTLSVNTIVLQVAFEGGGTGTAEYFCVLEEVEIKRTIKVIKNVKMFLMDNLLSEMIIGQA